MPYKTKKHRFPQEEKSLYQYIMNVRVKAENARENYPGKANRFFRRKITEELDMITRLVKMNAAKFRRINGERNIVNHVITKLNHLDRSLTGLNEALDAVDYYDKEIKQQKVEVSVMKYIYEEILTLLCADAKNKPTQKMIRSYRPKNVNPPYYAKIPGRGNRSSRTGPMPNTTTSMKNRRSSTKQIRVSPSTSTVTRDLFPYGSTESKKATATKSSRKNRSPRSRSRGSMGTEAHEMNVQFVLNLKQQINKAIHNSCDRFFRIFGKKNGTLNGRKIKQYMNKTIDPEFTAGDFLRCVKGIGQKDKDVMTRKEFTEFYSNYLTLRSKQKKYENQ